MQPIQRMRQYLVPASAALGKGAAIAFPLDQFLRDKLITGIEAFDDRTLTFGDNGQPIVTAADAILCSLTLVRQSREIVKGVPLQQINPLDMFGIYKELQPTVVDWQQSSVKINDAIGAATPFAFGFTVHYLD